jgi:hypothetical protein
MVKNWIDGKKRSVRVQSHSVLGSGSGSGPASIIIRCCEGGCGPISSDTSDCEDEKWYNGIETVPCILSLEI